MKKIILMIVGLSLLLAGCGLSFGKNDKEPMVPTELTAVGLKSLSDNMFYIKHESDFYPVVIGQTNLTDKTRIAKEEDSSRIMSFTNTDSLIPTLYKDDTLVYSTSTGTSNVTLERFKDNGWSVGLYNLQPDESSKVKYVIGTSSYDKTSSAGTGLSQVQINNESALVIIDRVGGKTISSEVLSESGIITGLKMGAVANIDLYVGTTHYDIPAIVDSHILSSMEIYQINDYLLNPDGYAEIVMPDYLLSGYYFVNGVGMFRYVANDRSEGVAGIDFSVPYFYKDQNGKRITKEAYDKLRGEKETLANEPSNSFSFEIDTTQKEYGIEILYKLKGNENPVDLGYKVPSAEIVSPDGKTISFEDSKKGDKQCFSVHLNGMKSGIWTVNIYHLEDYSFDINQFVSSGNADSFIHSGKGAGNITIHTDGISGPANAIITWQNSEHALGTAVITSPSGEVYSYDRSNESSAFASTYGKIVLPLEYAEAGDWNITVKGEELGRVWFTFEQREEIMEDKTEINTYDEDAEDIIAEETLDIETS